MLKTQSKTDYKNPLISKINLKSKSTLFNKPNLIHRLEAQSNLTLYETSTPHLDDVLRIADDTNRKDGLITKEHKVP